MKKLTLLLAVILVMGLFLPGCSGSDSDEKTVTVAISADGAMDQLDAASYNGPHPIYMMIYDGLVYDNGDEITPMLAESWDISSDGKTYTFKLREDVKFSDGTEFDADVVLFNMKRWVNDKAHETLTASMVEDMKALDKYTVQITYKNPSNAILKELTYPRPVRIISPNAVKEVEGDPVGEFLEPVGTGQWMLESYTENEEFVLVPNPNYWGEKPKIDKLVFKVIPDGEARTMALQSGEVDIIGGDLIGKINTENYKVLKDDDTFKTYEVDSILSYFLAFNQDTEFFKDLKVRQAINMGIDKNALVDDLLSGMGEPADSVFPPDSQYVNDNNIKGYEYNLQEAKKLLREAGYTDTDNDQIIEKDGVPFEIDLLLTADILPEWKTIGEFTQSELMKLGIKVNLTIVDENSYDDMRDKREFDMCIRRTSSDSWMPHGVIQDLFGRENPMMHAWIDSDLVELVNQTLAAQGEENIQSGYDQIFEMVYERAYTVPLYVPVTTFATSSRITNFEPLPNSYCAVNWTTLEVEE